jgi:hypothetical protein
VPLRYGRVLGGEALIQDLIEYAIEGVLVSLCRLIYPLLTLRRAACPNGIRQVVYEGAFQLDLALRIEPLKHSGLAFYSFVALEPLQRSGLFSYEWVWDADGPAAPRYRCQAAGCDCEVVLTRAPSEPDAWRPPVCHGMEMARV